MGLSRKQALECFGSDDLIGIGMEADTIRRKLHPEGVVSYALNAPVNASSPTAEEAIAAAAERGATGLLLYGLNAIASGELEPRLTHLHALSPALPLGLLESEVAALATQTELGQTLGRLQQCGIGWMEGDPAGSSVVLHRAAHAAGLPTIASLRFGAGESTEDRIAALEALRQLQDETGGIRAFSLNAAPAPTGRELDDPTAVEYLKTLAVSRMLLDNIPHIEGNWEQGGLKVLQMSLRFGANDTGSLLGRAADAGEEEVRRLIRDAGFKPAQRNSLYTALFLD